MSTSVGPAATQDRVTEDSAWEVHPQVAIRPERFGALLYHFQTRRLTFVKDRGLLAVITGLAQHPRIGDCFDAAGVSPERRGVVTEALQRLADGELLRPAVTRGST